MDGLSPAQQRPSPSPSKLRRSSSSSSLSSSEASSDVEASATARINPLDPLRRGSVMMEFLGAGAIALGSTLVVSLYVTGPPRIDDMATSSTAVLFFTLFFGVAAAIPSWAAAAVIIFTKKPEVNEPPVHGKLLQLLAVAALLFAALEAAAVFVLFVLLEEKSSFVSFCMQNLPSTTESNCEERWNRAWAMGLVVGIVLVFHIALGFPVYRYTRGSDGGEHLEDGLLAEKGGDPSSASKRAAYFKRWDSDTDEDFLPAANDAEKAGERTQEQQQRPTSTAQSLPKRRLSGRRIGQRRQIDVGHTSESASGAESARSEEEEEEGEDAGLQGELSRRSSRAQRRGRV